MAWWIRFYLGLPARPQDIEELRRWLPELFDPQFHLDEHLILPRWPFPFVQDLTVKDLCRWARSDEVPGEPAVASPEKCPAEECPLRRGPPLLQTGDIAIFHLMVAGGAHKPPKQEFLNLVRRVHKDQVINEVILTDAYIYLDLGEHGEGGGYSALVDYLDALGLSQHSRFQLKLNPSPKKATKNARRLLQRTVKEAFPKAGLGTFSPTHRFHDRFYLARDQSAVLTGIFGPSLNALTTKTIVLMGELENGALQRLGKLV